MAPPAPRNVPKTPQPFGSGRPVPRFYFSRLWGHFSWGALGASREGLFRDSGPPSVGGGKAPTQRQILTCAPTPHPLRPGVPSWTGRPTRTDTRGPEGSQDP